MSPIPRAPLPPGSTLGVLGGGQLGRMFAWAAARLGYRVHVYAPGEAPPAAQVAHEHTAAGFDDSEALHRFAESVSAITYETENLPADMVANLSARRPVLPQPHVLSITQDRAAERRFLHHNAIPVVDFRIAREPAEVRKAFESLGAPCVAKTTRGGYDGKGQALLRTADDADHAWQQLRAPELLVEAWAGFEHELSVIVARDADGDTCVYGPMRNVHVDHILDEVVFPAGFGEPIDSAARDLGRRVAAGLELIGVCCVEMFLLPGGELRVNEIAPRPHNSGHLTIEAHHASQFEQQARAMAGLPLGSAAPRVGAAAMVNLLGRHLPEGWPPERWAAALTSPGAVIHLYGKDEARPGRKMGHVTATGGDADEALAAAEAARRALSKAHSIPTPRRG